MQTPGSIWVRAELLKEAVGAVVPKRRKNARRPRRPYPVSLIYIAADEALGVKEARHALRGYRVPAVGQWPDKVQVDGWVLAALVVKYPPDSDIELVALRGELAILQGKNQVRLKRLDAGYSPGIVETPPPRDRRHKGPVIVPPDEPPSGRFEWNDTWLFSARVPFPQHRMSTGEARRSHDADRAENRGAPENGAGK